MAIDYGTPAGQLRLLISDVSEGAFILTAEQVDGYLALWGIPTPDVGGAATRATVKRAAADALDAIAISEVLVSKVIKTQDLTTDGAKVATALHAQAVGLRAQADAEDATDEGGFFDVAEFSPWPS